MKICAIQTRPVKGDIAQNIRQHKELIELAVTNGAELIFFPELSITSYEPELVSGLMPQLEHFPYSEFQHLADTHRISIGIGMPTQALAGIQISMNIFQPQELMKMYSKQYLHKDEEPYFVPGDTQLFFYLDGNKIAPAICYESLLPKHTQYAFNQGAGIYLASVAKSEKGVRKAMKYYAKISRKYAMTVAMANCVGPCDNFTGAGQSAIWNGQGMRVGQLSSEHMGLIIYDTVKQEVTETKII